MFVEIRGSIVRVLVAMGIAGIALILAACADSEETSGPTKLPTMATPSAVEATITTATTEPIKMIEEGSPEKVASCCPSPRVSGGEFELYGFRSPIYATFYFREKIQTYKLVRIDEQSIDESECRENQPLRTGSGHHALALVDIWWEKTYQLIPYESDDCSGPAIGSYPYPLTFFGWGLLEDYSRRNITNYEPYPLIPNDPLLPPDRLRVVGLECLDVRSAPIMEAKVSECVPEGELLWTSDEDEEWNVDGLSWRQVKRSEEGRTEYADIRYLEGAEASPRGDFKRAGRSNFLVVYGMEDCLDVRAGPGLHTDVVDCVPEGTGLTFDPRGISADGTIWLSLEWDGQRVWGDDRFLKGKRPYPRDITAGELLAPAMELPGDVALVGFATISEYVGHGYIVRSREMIRIRKRPNGELVREMLSTPERFGPSNYRRNVIATQDLSRIVVAADRTLYESFDGGLSWSYLDDLEAVRWPQFQLHFIPADNDGDPEQVLSVVWSRHGGHDTIFTLHPSGERETLSPFEPWYMSRLWQLHERVEMQSWFSEGKLIGSAWFPEIIDDFVVDAWFSEGKLIGSAWFPQPALIREGVVEDGAIAACCNNRRYWPAIYDLETGSIHALAIPGVLQPEEELWPLLGLQQGPFLRVSLPGDCKNVRAEPGLDAEILDCAAEGVLLRDLGEQAEHGGRTWLKVRTPAGIEGWSSSRYLQ